jgi:hypothetical protein
MVAAKIQSIRLTAEDVAILDEIQRRTGFIGYSDSMRYALRQYAQAAGIDVSKSKTKTKTKTK